MGIHTRGAGTAKWSQKRITNRTTRKIEKRTERYEVIQGLRIGKWYGTVLGGI